MMDKNGLYDIYGVWHLPFWQTTWFKYLCASLIALVFLLVGVAIGYRLYQWIRHKQYTAWEIALMKLEQLKKNHYATQDEAKQAYGVITAVLKEYLSKRYGWSVTSATDDELAQVQSSSLK